MPDDTPGEFERLLQEAVEAHLEELAVRRKHWDALDRLYSLATSSLPTIEIRNRLHEAVEEARTPRETEESL